MKDGTINMETIVIDEEKTFLKGLEMGEEFQVAASVNALFTPFREENEWVIEVEDMSVIAHEIGNDLYVLSDKEVKDEK